MRFSFSQLDQRNLYLIFFSGDNRQDWFIGITQATDLVFAMREGQTASRKMLVEFFLLNGAQFYTFSPVPQSMYIFSGSLRHHFQGRSGLKIMHGWLWTPNTRYRYIDLLILLLFFRGDDGIE